MRTLLLVAALGWCALAAACGGARAAGNDPSRLITPAEVGPVVLSAIELPAAGTSIGGHYQGANYAVRQLGYQLTDALRVSWSQEARRRGERILRLAGYFVEEVGPSSDARRLDFVDYSLSGRVTTLEVRTSGTAQPWQVDAQVETSWELLDLVSGEVLLGRVMRGGARLAGAVDSAVVLALDQSLERLLADTVFLRTLAAPRADVMVETSRGWTRPLPQPGEAIALEQNDLNISGDTVAVQRVSWGVLSLHGPGGAFYGSAFLLSRDGLALTTNRIGRALSRARVARARLSSGVERPVRVVRSGGGLNVALIQVQCPGLCPTVDWRAPQTMPPLLAVLIVGSTGERSAVSPGVIGGRWGIAHGITLDTDTGSAGEPIATPGTGRVFAMVAGVPGRPTALMLHEVFRTLNVRVSDELRRTGNW